MLVTHVAARPFGAIQHCRRCLGLLVSNLDAPQPWHFFEEGALVAKTDHPRYGGRAVTLVAEPVGEGMCKDVHH